MSTFGQVSDVVRGGNMTMTPAQVSHFRTFGFVSLRGYLDDREVDALRDEVVCAMEEAYAETPFDGTARHWVPLLSPRAPITSGLAEDSRFLGAAEELVGEGVVLFMADANRYVGDTGWHNEGRYGGEKIMLYLEPIAAETGALRIIPGSHNEGFSKDIRAYFDTASPDQRSVKAEVCDSEPGDVIAFDFRAWHASFGGSNDRRLCTIEYYQAPEGPETLDAIQEHVATLARVTLDVWPRKQYPFYDGEWIANGEGSATRQAMIERMTAAGVFQAAEQATAPR